MNRNQMYTYLKSKGLYPMMHYRDRHKKTTPTYHTEFVPDKDRGNMSINMIILDWGYIRGFSSIYLCKNEIVIVSDYGTAKINMNYKDINKFEVIIDDLDEDEIMYVD